MAIPDAINALPSAVRTELALRELARRNLAHFLRYWFAVRRRPLVWNWHIDYLSDLLTAVTRREIRRLIINIPPRFLKSELVSVAWHAWMIGIDDGPRSAMLSSAATATLAGRDSRRTLQILQSDWYKNLFPGVQIIKEREVEWETAKGSTRNAAGRGGTITGLGGDHLVWDDLLLASEADSEAARAEAKYFLDEVLPSRHNNPKTGTIVGIMQRLHEEDPTGHLLEQMKNAAADQYMHVVLPNEAPSAVTVEYKGKVYARRKPGDLLFPERLDAKATAALKAKGQSYDGQYQQSPTKMQGGELDPSLIQTIDLLPAQIIKQHNLIPNLYCDFAVATKQTQKDDPDYSVIAAMARDQMDRIIVLDVWRGQVRLDQALDQLIALWRRMKPRRVKAEKGVIKMGLEAVMLERWRRIGSRLFHLDPLEADADKVRRAQALRTALNDRVVYAPAGALWLPGLRHELRSFPNGKHDDQVDALAYGARDLQDLRASEPPTIYLPGVNLASTATGAQIERMLDEKKKREERGSMWD
jgi:predicted phage terminase large subunit-like protein